MRVEGRLVSVQSSNQQASSPRESLTESGPDRKRDIGPRSSAQNSGSDSRPVETCVDLLNEAVSLLNKGLRFFVDDDSDRLVVQVVDRQTDQVLRQIPPDEILALVGRINDMIGLLIDEKA